MCQGMNKCQGITVMTEYDTVVIGMLLDNDGKQDLKIRKQRLLKRVV